MNSFWNKLPEPFFMLAPMADVTDAAFRRIIAKYSKPAGPDVMYTEFVSANGLFLADEEGRGKLMKDLLYTKEERPIVAQFFTSRPEMMERAARLAEDLGFDGVDINMGCPDRSIEKQGAGAALIKNPELARKLIRIAQNATTLPVSIKTRLGYNGNELETWIPELLKAGVAAIIIHARTRKEMSKVSAHWDQIARAVELRNEIAPKTLIIGNGDVMSLEEGKQKVHETGCDGIMFGRAIFGNPWLFSSSQEETEEVESKRSTSIYRCAPFSFGERLLKKRLQVMVEHTKLFEELLPHKNFAVMKKHYKAYVQGFPGASEFRTELMMRGNAEEVEQSVRTFLKKKRGIVEV